MEDSEFLQIMVETWMYLKGLGDGRRADLSGRSLIGLNALKERLVKAILAALDFIGSELSGSDFRRCRSCRSDVPEIWPNRREVS